MRPQTAPKRLQQSVGPKFAVHAVLPKFMIENPANPPIGVAIWRAPNAPQTASQIDVDPKRNTVICHDALPQFMIETLANPDIGVAIGCAPKLHPNGFNKLWVPNLLCMPRFRSYDRKPCKSPYWGCHLACPKTAPREFQRGR